jgi:hypothetical protein
VNNAITKQEQVTNMKLLSSESGKSEPENKEQTQGNTPL